MNQQRWKGFNMCHIKMGDILFPWGEANMELWSWFICAVFISVSGRDAEPVVYEWTSP